jgi:hypothetical protein
MRTLAVVLDTPGGNLPPRVEQGYRRPCREAGTQPGPFGVEDIDHLAHEVKEMKALPTPSKRKIGFDL